MPRIIRRPSLAGHGDTFQCYNKRRGSGANCRVQADIGQFRPNYGASMLNASGYENNGSDSQTRSTNPITHISSLMSRASQNISEFKRSKSMRVQRMTSGASLDSSQNGKSRPSATVAAEPINIEGMSFFNGAKIPDRADELDPDDKMENKLINLLCVLHVVSILCVFLLFRLGWNDETSTWEPDNFMCNTLKLVLSVNSIIGCGVTVYIRAHEAWYWEDSICGLATAVEIFVVTFHVPPGFDTAAVSWMDTLNCLVFARSYIFIEYLRVRSELWRLRRHNVDRKGVHARVGCLYFTKVTLNANPLKFFSWSSVMLLMALAQTMQVLERWEQEDMDIRACLYYMVIVFTSVGLGDIFCVTWLGRSLTLLAAFGGFVFLSVCVGFLFEAVEMQEVEAEVNKQHIEMLALVEYRNLAAQAIQRWWRAKGKVAKQIALKSIGSGGRNFTDMKAEINERMQQSNKESIGQGVRINRTMLRVVDQRLDKMEAMLTMVAHQIIPEFRAAEIRRMSINALDTLNTGERRVSLAPRDRRASLFQAHAGPIVRPPTSGTNRAKTQALLEKNLSQELGAVDHTKRGTENVPPEKYVPLGQYDSQTPKDSMAEGLDEEQEL